MKIPNEKIPNLATGDIIRRKGKIPLSGYNGVHEKVRLLVLDLKNNSSGWYILAKILYIHPVMSDRTKLKVNTIYCLTHHELNDPAEDYEMISKGRLNEG
tara:strand:+ start:336 stop:635 length:300 start_codon:yes stop_codon:yes gene_type:complete